jgi:hypothetical protein
MTPTAFPGLAGDSRLLAVLFLTAGSLAGVIIQLSNDTTPGTGNISPASITCIAMFVGQLIWLIAFARKKEPKDEKHRVWSHLEPEHILHWMQLGGFPFLSDPMLKLAALGIGSLRSSF